MMRTIDKGNITELKVAARLAELGYTVLFPHGGNATFDLVAYKDGQFSRIQCKAGREKERGVFQFNTVRTNGSNGVTRGYNSDEIDFFASWDFKRETMYLMRVEDAPGGRASLRVAPTKNGQEKGVRMAGDYKDAECLAT